MTITVRNCTLDDIYTLQEISYETFNQAYKHLNTPEVMETYLENAFNLEKLTKELSNQNSFFFFLYLDNDIAGYLKVNIDDAQTDNVADDALEIERIYVRHTYQGHGFGECLIHKAVETAENLNKNKIWLSVWEINEGAIRFYKRMGFVESGTRDFFMADERQTDFVMIKTLK
jgi:ribosomal protein S18 acetylase RimI-like enzyme